MMPSIAIRNPSAKPQIFVYLDYGVAGEPWHERWVAYHIGGRDYIVITPDLDVYVETLAVPPLRNLRLGSDGRRLPDDLGARFRQPVYRFAAGGIPTETLDEAAFLHEKSSPPTLPIAGAGGKSGSKSSGDSWLVVDDASGGATGTVLNEADGLVLKHRVGSLALGRFEDRDLALRSVPTDELKITQELRDTADKWHPFMSGITPKAPAPDGGDVRTLAVKWQINGLRMRPFSESVNLMEEEPCPDGEYALAGPRISQWFLHSVVNSGTTPITRHSRWVVESGVGTESRSAHEHFLLSHVIEKACVFDQVNAMNLACLELVMRRLALLEEAHGANPSHPNFEGSEHWLGLGEKRAGALIPPALSKYVANKVADETLVQKEKRKAREERKLSKVHTQDPKAGAKGAGKGD